MALQQHGRGAEDEELSFLETGAGTSASLNVPVAQPVGPPMEPLEMGTGTTTPGAQGQRGGAAGASSIGGIVASSAQGVANMFKRASHPKIAVAHVAFKVAAFFLYLFAGLVADNFVVTFVVCVILLAFDFWTVKNVTGRLMVGLRWWNEIEEDGSSSWRFESVDNPDEVSTVDYRIFWYSMYINFILWAFFFFFALIKFSFDWLPLTGVAISLQTSNIYGYWQCSKDAKRRLQGAVQGAVTQGALSALSSGWIARAMGRTPSEQTAPLQGP
ncbi:Golgi apparatus membrane protein tvp23 [Hondaea fermentalgiana]|uniref:Golgi apparatus membrane protein TVP23 homolog n=1 Tax=Hondaea fermentalgiana TaxID=2315210 RepID=A0A2R5G2Q9_9STRA|nr:Golgi apparatus membrane protein tvp23 [Hondaea fermentalgiana]|eukprot:GBG25290.1 Golgi apparatus membrane protein tvp23 [Hondaea fermentalgiana]